MYLIFVERTKCEYLIHSPEWAWPITHVNAKRQYAIGLQEAMYLRCHFFVIEYGSYLWSLKAEGLSQVFTKSAFSAMVTCQQ